MEARISKDQEVVDLLSRRGRSEVRGADELLADAAKGDEAAFAQFYDIVVARVFGIVRSVLRDPARSEEVTQEVMLELWRTAPRYQRDLGSATTWALTIAHRRAVDRVRSEQAGRDREERHALQNPEVPEPDTSNVVIDLLDRERVVRALAELTDTQRESIELAFFGGHSHSEVAALLELPLGTVKTRIRDGLVRLRDRLEVMS
ncbi:MAG: ECF RNA polymerase sigma factor SigK [Acidimicrobiales bacterium]